jgi:hypothetical protein
MMHEDHRTWPDGLLLHWPSADMARRSDELEPRNTRNTRTGEFWPRCALRPVRVLGVFRGLGLRRHPPRTLPNQSVEANRRPARGREPVRIGLRRPMHPPPLAPCRRSYPRLSASISGSRRVMAVPGHQRLGRSLALPCACPLDAAWGQCIHPAFNARTPGAESPGEGGEMATCPRPRSVEPRPRRG